ncbi:MAG: DUF1246 domain-containing protein, partial [Candidatus Methanosuratincola petrocarbonis]
MITRERIWELIENYESGTDKPAVGTLGSHSALDIADGAKEQGFHTIVVCQRGRERPYKTYRRIVDEAIVLDKFSEIASHEVQEELRRKKTVFVPHRAFSTYVPYDVIEDQFMVPLFGNRMMLRSEERWAPKNQYYLLEKAGVRQPRKFKSPSEIDTLAIVKVQEARRKIERAFFTVTDERDFWMKVEERVSKGIITREDAEKAVIEEYVVGTYFNFNYFYSPLSGEVEFMGIDRRLQTNLHD